MKRTLLAAAACLVAFAHVTTAQAYECKQKYSWKLGFNTVKESIRGAATDAFKKVLEEKTQKCATVQVFPGETLGTEQEMIEAIQLNAIDMTMCGGGALSNVNPLFGATTLPFLFRDFKEAQTILEGPFGDRLKAAAAERNIQVLTFAELGFAQITNSARPINKVDDLYGLKIRSPKENTLITTMESLGASVTPMPFSEVYLALSQKVVDGQFNPLDAIYENKFHEVQKYLALVNVFYYNTVLAMSKKLYDGLDPELKKIVMEAGKAAQAAAYDYAVKKDAEMIEKMKPHFAEITKPDTDPFQAKVQVVYENFTKKVGDISDLTNSIKAYRAKK